MEPFGRLFACTRFPSWIRARPFRFGSVCSDLRQIVYLRIPSLVILYQATTATMSVSAKTAR
jgi:hypothetical protein